VELINQNHTDQDIYLPINATEKQLYNAWMESALSARYQKI
jgi:hypothetical protein